MTNHGEVTLNHKLLILPRRVQVLVLVRLEESARRLLEADHILDDVLATMAIVVVTQHVLVDSLRWLSLDASDLKHFTLFLCRWF